MNVGQDLKSLFDRAENHPIIQQIREDEANELLEKRTKASAKIKSLEVERASKNKELRGALQEKQSRYDEVRDLFESVKSELYQAKAAVLNTSFKYDNLINKQKDVLLSSFSPLIAECIEFFRAKLEYFRRPGVINSQPMGSVTNLVSYTKSATVVTNRPAVLGAISYCQRALTDLDDVKLLPEVDGLWIKSLEGGISDESVYSDTSIESNIPVGQEKPVLMSDSHHEYVTSKLLEKADTVLHGKQVAAYNAQVRAGR